MILFRSLLFAVLFYANMIVQLLLFWPIVLLGDKRTGWGVVRRWARSNLFLLRVVAGVKADIRGKERIVPGPAIIAIKHQSFWDVFALVPDLDFPTFILKKELMAIPLFGWYAKRLGMIPVDREKRGAALSSLLKGAQRAMAEGRQIVIFPEGTRTPPGADPEYRPGVNFLYSRLKVQVLPVALNSGLYWPRRSLRRLPGTILAEFLPPIAPGLTREVMLATLRTAIEDRSIDLLREAVAADPALPVGELVRERLKRDAVGHPLPTPQ